MIISAGQHLGMRLHKLCAEVQLPGHWSRAAVSSAFHCNVFAQVPAQVYRYGRHAYNGVPVVEERCFGEGARLVTPDCSPDLSSKLRMQDLVHSDSITQLAAVQGVGRLLVSASRDGCIKVWK